MPILIAILATLVIVFLYVGTGILNDRAGVPEGCEEAYMEAQECESCNIVGTDACHINSEPKFQDAIQFMKEVKL